MALGVKNPPANVGDVRDMGSILGSGKSPGGGHSNPLQLFLPGKSHGQRSLASYSSSVLCIGSQRVRHD